MFTLMALVSVGDRCDAATIWYTGDYDGFDSAPNETNSAPTPPGLVYDNFVVAPGEKYTITSAFSTNFMNYTGVTSAYWEIRTGMSEGNGGSIVDSGTASATQVDLNYNVYGNEAYTITATGLNVVLTAGTYWLAIAPVSVPTDNLPAYYSYIATTSGANGIGSPIGTDGSPYINDPGYGYNYLSALDYEGQAEGYSMGLGGTVTLPEPSSVTLLGLSGAILIACRFGRKRITSR
jgi:hypothetical protein